MTFTPDIENELAKRIRDSVKDGLEGQLEFTKELVRKPSVRGQEHTAQDFLYKQLKQRGYAMDRWAIDVAAIENHPGFSPVKVSYENAINVVGTHRPKQEVGRTLILNGHVDVVPTGPIDMWDHHPFEPHVEGDWLYGRGSGDMKAGLVANIFAMDALRRLGCQPAATLHLQSVTEEECTGNGALSALARGYSADAVIIPEPENEALVRASVGVIWFRVHVKGIPVHVATAGSGQNAIEAAIYLITQLKEYEVKRNALKVNHPHFAEFEKPINVNIGKIEGGDWASSVPGWCSFDVRTALYPGEDAAEMAKEIEAFISAAASEHAFLQENTPEVEFNGFMAQGYELEEGSDAEKTLAVAHNKVTAQQLETFGSLAYLDARVFMLYDNTPCLVYGPTSKGIHGYNEAVSLESIENVTTAIALYIAMWCGLEPIGD